MTLINTLRIAGFSMLLFACAGIAAAQGPVTDLGTTTSELEMGATVETTLQLNISTHGSGSAVTGSNSTGVFSINLGTVNGLGIGTPAANVTVVADATGALYSTPINLTPVYSGFEAGTADVTVISEVGANNVLAREGDASISAASVVAASHVAFSDAASGSANTRYVGFYIPRAEASGAKTAVLIYTVTMGL